MFNPSSRNDSVTRTETSGNSTKDHQVLLHENCTENREHIMKQNAFRYLPYTQLPRMQVTAELSLADLRIRIMMTCFLYSFDPETICYEI